MDVKLQISYNKFYGSLVSPFKVRHVFNELVLTSHGNNAKLCFHVVSTGADKKAIWNLTL